jgi:hypothetical protein
VSSADGACRTLQNGALRTVRPLDDVAEALATYADSVGTLYYGDSGTPIGIEDRALAHLKIAITTKLRRGESFTLSWVHPDEQPRGRSTLWLHPSIPLRFVFDEPEAPELSRSWIEDLMRSANSTGGVQLVPEQLDTEAIPTSPGQPVQVGVDVQEVDTTSETQPA